MTSTLQFNIFSDNIKNLTSNEVEHEIERALVLQFIQLKISKPDLKKKDLCKLLNTNINKLNILLKKHGFDNYVRKRSVKPKLDDSLSAPSDESTLETSSSKSLKSLKNFKKSKPKDKDNDTKNKNKSRESSLERQDNVEKLSKNF